MAKQQWNSFFRQHFYVGSANFDWRSLTQVKEIGVLALNCPTLASDMSKIFEVYWMLGGQNKTIPDEFPSELETSINKHSPLIIDDFSVFLSSSPPPFCPKGREIDVKALLDVIDQAEQFVYVAVMDYAPAFLYSQMAGHFWPDIDNSLRKGNKAENGASLHLTLTHLQGDVYSIETFQL